MKQWIRRGAALGLALALTVTAASASQAMGWDVHTGRAPLSQGASLGKNVFWSDTYSDLRTEYYVEYSPNASVVPTVAYGSKVTDRVTLSGMAQTLESQGKRVVSGLNGDWYVLSTGAPTGLVVTDGIVRATGYYNDTWAIGFNADGTAFIARNGLSVSVSFGGQAVKLGGGINKVRKLTDSAAVGGLTLLTDDFATTTQNTEPGVDVILSPVDDGTGTYAVKPTIGRQTQYVVEQVLESTGSIPIPEGKAVLTLNAKESEEALARLRALQPGDTVTLTVSSSDQRWSQAVQALGGVSKLVTNGQVDSGLDASRTAWPAIGIKADGTVIFYAMDGKQPGYSVGATQGQVAQRLIELGCVEAICMDGGGSTTITVTQPDDTTAATINRPSDGSERAVANHLFLVATNEPTGELGHFYVQADNAYVLAGSKVEISAAAVDTNYIPMDEDYDYDLEASDGELDGNILTTPKRGGEITVTASSGRREGSTTVYAIEDPTDVVIRDSSGTALTTLNAATGTTTQLAATAAYNHISLKADPEAFTWEVTGDIGTVDEHGLFTAAAPGTGTITVSAGRARVSIPVTVSSSGTVSAGGVMEVESFEGSTTIFRGSGSNMDFSLNHSADTVRMGSGSAKVDYTLTETGASQGAYTAEWRASKSTGIDCSTYTALHLWVYGDGSGNILSLLYNDGAAGYQSLQVTPLDFTGWKQVTVTLPGAHFEIQGLQVSATTAADGTVSVGDKLSGTIYIDHITATASGTPDNAAPVVSASLDNSLWQVTASVADAVDGILPAGSVTVTYNGAPYGSYDPATGLVTVALPGPGESHEAMRITITARDLSGNIGRASHDIQPASSTDPEAPGYTGPFVDMTTHWARAYTTYLYDMGVTNGVETTEGLQFQPEKNITRGEFALMVTRWMGLNPDDYAGVELPFADLASIPSWMLGGMKATYSLGILKGSLEGGQLVSRATETISRAEAMTILGRIQPKGYPLAALTFNDAASVAGWARSHVQSLVGQGVISGYDNQLRPNDPVKRSEVAKMLYAIL